jgi:hypothetical protein
MGVDITPNLNTTPRMYLDTRRSMFLSGSTDGLLIAAAGHGGIANLVVVADKLYAVPIMVRDTIHVSRMMMRVETGSAGLNDMRMGLYTDLNGYPDRRLFVETEITNTNTAELKFQTIDLVLPYGIYWGALVFNDTPTVTAEGFAGGGATGGANWNGVTTNIDTLQYPGIRVDFTYAALPATFTGGGVLFGDEVPRVFLQMGRYEFR